MKNLLSRFFVAIISVLEYAIMPVKLEGGQPVGKMAKIKFGMMVTDARGKLGGHVFSKNRAGAYTRTKVTPVNPQSSAQVAVRNQFTNFTQNFRSLTASQILAWNSAVVNFVGTDIFGDSKTPSGINLYNKLNLNLANAGQSAITSPPLPVGADAVEITGVTADVSSTLFTIASAAAAVPAGHTLIIEATGLVSPGKSYVKSEFRVIGTAAAAATFPITAYSDWNAKFGTLVAGQKVFCRVKTVNNTTGETSGYSQVSTIVVP